MEHLLKTCALIAIFYVCYKLFLQRETFFEQNRWFLILGIFTSFLLPFLVIPIYIETTPLDLSNFTFETATTQENVKKPLNVLDYLPIIYGLGVAVFFIKFLVQFVSLGLVIFKNEGKNTDGFTYIKTNTNISPFSFFNWIVFNPNPFSETELNQILTHEKIHANQKHSFDIILTHISCILLWFNPFIWLYNKDLKQNLEFIADNIAATKTNCKKSYQYTLLKTSMPSHQMALSNPFYNSLIKKRIVMLHKSKSKKINQLKYALVIPVLALFLMSFNTEEVYVQDINTKNQNTESSKNIMIIFNKKLTDSDIEKIKVSLKKDNIEFTFTNLKRNESEEIISISTEFKNEKGNTTWNAYNTSNKPIESFYFFKNDKSFGVSKLDKETTISDGNLFIFKSDDDKKISNEKIIIKNADTLHVLKNSNGKTITVTTDDDGKKIQKIVKIRTNNNNTTWTTVEDENEKIVVSSETNTKVKIISTNGKDPLYILDGKEINKDIITSMNPNSIQSIDVIKDDNATRLYGDKGKNGVILITTKKNKWETQFIVGKPFDSIPKKEDTSKYSVKLSNKTLYKIDGKEVKKADVDKLNPDNIATINVFKDDIATMKYSEKGKHGVVEITTKKK